MNNFYLFLNIIAAFIIILLSMYIFTDREKFYNVSLDDEKFLYQCFPKNTMHSFRKYYPYANVNYYRNTNNDIEGMVFDTDNSIISETPNLTNNGLYISHLCVAKNKRGNGLGTKMMKDMEIKCKKMKKDHLVLLVKDSNLKAIKLYKSLGYIKQQEGKLSDGSTACYYVKYIN